MSETYKIICWASEVIEVEADSEEEAEELAVESCCFPWVDYCEEPEVVHE
jgi:hypothetical protein